MTTSKLGSLLAPLQSRTYFPDTRDIFIEGLETVIEKATRAVRTEAFRELNRADRAEVLAKLGACRRAMAYARGDLGAFDDAIRILRDAEAEAVGIKPDPSRLFYQPSTPASLTRFIDRGTYLGEECLAWQQRCEVSGDPADAERAICKGVHALACLEHHFDDTDAGTPTIPRIVWDDRGGSVTSLECRWRLARAYTMRLKQLAAEDDLDLAVLWLLSSVPEARFNYIQLRDAVADALRLLLLRCELRPSNADLGLAASIGRRLVDERSEGTSSPVTHATLAGLALCLLGLEAGASHHLDDAAQLLRESLTEQDLRSPQVRAALQVAEETAQRSLAVPAARSILCSLIRDLAAQTFPWLDPPWIEKHLGERGEPRPPISGRSYVPPSIEGSLGHLPTDDDYATGTLIEIASDLNHRWTAYALASSQRLAIHCARLAAARAGAETPLSVDAHYVVGESLLHWSERASTGPLSPLEHNPDREEMLTAFRQASELSHRLRLPNTVRIAMAWATVETQELDWPRAAAAYCMALSALHRDLSSVDGPERNRTLLRSWGISTRGAYALASIGDRVGALVMLEHGRAIEAFSSRDRAWPEAEFEELRCIDLPELARGYEMALEEYRPLLLGPPFPPGERLLVAEEVWQQQKSGSLVTRSGLRRIVLEKVRAIAATGPVLYLIASQLEGIALLVTAAGDVEVVRLRDLTEINVRKRVASVYAAYRKKESDPEAFSREIEQLSSWFWQAVFGKLDGAFGGQEQITVVPTGMLALLPLSLAARPEDPDGARASLARRWTHRLVGALSPEPTSRNSKRYFIDDHCLRVLPSACALRDPESGSSTPPVRRALVISEPSPTSLARLQMAEVECEIVRTMFRSANVLSGRNATRDRVLKALSGSELIHFSCHGLADQSEPMQTCLIMSNDEKLTVGDVREVGVEDARLIVLGACESALVGREIPDEVIGLPTMLVAAGARCVVGSLWKVPDVSSMLVLSKFYDLWWGDGLDPIRALSGAQRWVRDSTNREKLDLLERLQQPGRGHEGEPHRPLLALLQSSPGARDFSDPVHWAPFVLVGW